MTIPYGVESKLTFEWQYVKPGPQVDSAAATPRLNIPNTI